MKYKIFGIGAVVLLLLFSMSPAVYAEARSSYYDDIWLILDDYEDEIEELNDYLDWAISQGLVDHNFELPSYYQEIFDMIWDDIEEEVDFEEWQQSLNLRGGVNSIDADWFIQFFNPMGYGFWIDMWMDHEHTQALDDATNFGTTGVSIVLLVFCVLVEAAALVIQLIWIFASFLINGIADEMGDVDEGDGAHLYWKHFIYPTTTIYDIILIEAQ